MAKTVKEYGNESITQLKGPDQVRLRPAVIFGSDGLDGCKHSVFEIISNSLYDLLENSIYEIVYFISDNNSRIKNYLTIVNY